MLIKLLYAYCMQQYHLLMDLEAFTFLVQMHHIILLGVFRLIAYDFFEIFSHRKMSKYIRYSSMVFDMHCAVNQRKFRWLPGDVQMNVLVD